MISELFCFVSVVLFFSLGLYEGYHVREEEEHGRL
jgi:hypothetical protein